MMKGSEADFFFSFETSGWIGDNESSEDIVMVSEQGIIERVWTLELNQD